MDRVYDAVTRLQARIEDSVTDLKNSLVAANRQYEDAYAKACRKWEDAVVEADQEFQQALRDLGGVFGGNPATPREPSTTTAAARQRPGDSPPRVIV